MAVHDATNTKAAVDAADHGGPSRATGPLPWWASGLIGSVLLVVVSAVRLGAFGSGRAANYGWYTTASGRQLQGLIVDQVQYLQLTDHFSGRAPVIEAEPWTPRALAPWLAGQLGGDAGTALWVVNVACLVLGTFALARLAMDLTGHRNWTLAAVALWAVSFPVFWYTPKAFVDAASVGLMVCALLALYRRRLLPGMIILVLAIWAKETALVLVPLAVVRELLDRPDTRDEQPAGGRSSRRRWVRAGAWVIAGVAAFATAELLTGGHTTAYAPWLPPTVASSVRMIHMNLVSPSGLVQFLLTAGPAVLGVCVWVRARRTERPFLADRDAVPLVIGAVGAVGLGAWSFFAALWDGRTAWMSLPFGALLLASWASQRRFTVTPRRVVALGAGLGGAAVAVLVLWSLVGAAVNHQVTSRAATALQDIEPRFAAVDRVSEPAGRTRFSGRGDGELTIDAETPVLVRFESTEPVEFRTDGEELLSHPAHAGTFLVDAQGPTRVEVGTDGRWSARVLRVDRAIFWEALSTISGDGPQVVVFPGGLVNSVEVQVRGDVELRPVGRCRLDECAPLTSSKGAATVTLPAGTEALVIDSAGTWELVPTSLSDADVALVLEGTRHG